VTFFGVHVTLFGCHVTVYVTPRVVCGGGITAVTLHVTLFDC
jgi:hypothetical protein